MRLLSGLEHAEPRARTDFAKPLEHFQQFLRRRGMVVFISDFYESPEHIVRTIEPLRFHGNEVVLFHVLDPKEIRPEFREPATLVDLETQERMEVTPEYARDEYRKKFDAHIEALRDKARGVGHGLSPARHRPAARRRPARIPLDPPGEGLDGPVRSLVSGRARRRWACRSIVHLLRRHTTTPHPFSSLMFFERRTQSSIKHRRLRYLLLLSLRIAAVVCCWCWPSPIRSSTARRRA